ncbi:hypothetical protein [Natrononativus amylolyticus]|nr:hypothetical protein [Natrononativus amylolyticus]
MSIDGWRPVVSDVRAAWTRLERDWQSVVVGAAIVALTAAFGVQIPW